MESAGVSNLISFNLADKNITQRKGEKRNANIHMWKRYLKSEIRRTFQASPLTA